MADINVERKGPSIWPWIVGLIVLALLIWALMEMFGRDDTARVAPVTDTVGVVHGDTAQWGTTPMDTVGRQPMGTDTFGAPMGMDTLPR